MADTAVVGIGADLSSLRRELAKLPNLSAEAAQKTLIQVEKTVIKAEKAAKQANKRIRKGNKKTVGQLERMGETAGDADTAIAGIASAIGLISPEAEAATRAVGDVLAGAEGFARFDKVLSTAGVSMASLGTAAVALAPVVIAGGAAWLHYQKKAKDARIASEKLAGQLKTLRTAGQDLTGTVDALHLSTLVSAGRFDEQGVSAAEAVEGVMDLADAQETAAQAMVASDRALMAQAKEGTEEYAAAQKSLHQSEELLGLVREKGAQEVERATNLVIWAAEQRKKAADEAAADEAADKAAQDAAEWAQSAAEASENRAKVEDILTAATAARLEPLERLRIEEEQMIATLEELGASETELQGLRDEYAQRRQDQRDAEQQAVDEAANANYEAMRDSIEKVRKAQKKSSEEQEEEQERAIISVEDRNEAVAQSMSDIAGAGADAFKSIAESMAEAGQEGAEEVFVAYKAAAISQAVIDAALAISGIWAQFSAYPPVAAALTAGAVAVSGVQIATIAAEQPSFHRGGMVSARSAMAPDERRAAMAPDERRATVLSGESVLNRAATRRLGAAGVAAMNAGMSQGQGSRMVVVEHRNRQFSSALRDAQRRDGSPIREHRRGGRRYAR